MLRPSFSASMFSFLIFLRLSSDLSPAEDWPQWRGPNRDAISREADLLEEWPAGGPPLIWKASGLGEGYSSVSISNERIFTMGDRANNSYVQALDSAGRHLWSAKVGPAGGGDGYPGPRCTPTVDGDLVFVLGQFGDLVCLEASSGKENWRKNLKSDFAGQMMSDWGYSESPLVDGRRLVCTPGGSKGTVVALDKQTGDRLWQTTQFTDPAAYASLVIAEIGGVRQYICLTGASVAGIASETGRVLWRAERRGSTAVVATPVVHDNHVFVTSSYGIGCHLFKVTPAAGQFQVEEIYSNRNMKNHHGGVVRVGAHIYGFDDAILTCLDFQTGKILWDHRSVGKGSLVYADRHLYLRSEGRGTVALVEATPTGYREKARFEQPERSSNRAWPHPVVSGGKLYLRDQEVLLCYEVKGSQLPTP